MICTEHTKAHREPGGDKTHAAVITTVSLKMLNHTVMVATLGWGLQPCKAECKQLSCLDSVLKHHSTI